MHRVLMVRRALCVVCVHVHGCGCGCVCMRVGGQVFGLGNKTYEHYNSMGKFWDARLAELGAHRVYDMGLGDDDGKYVHV
jgi:hypothetical protein